MIFEIYAEEKKQKKIEEINIEKCSKILSDFVFKNRLVLEIISLIYFIQIP